MNLHDTIYVKDPLTMQVYKAEIIGLHHDTHIKDVHIIMYVLALDMLHGYRIIISDCEYLATEAEYKSQVTHQELIDRRNEIDEQLKALSNGI